ncbi:alkaline phosphatase family protein [Sphingomonas piscis]|uniref:Alkaline phosphatase n=1 Tax=Sphingomonas piscis TaxID=2714943 RepID=A0A6G7YS51_9SPHN|nr:alkaline phosphatase family protein [Sphingomonas piscis]QIK79570.1 alkaline phosphatase family protein [Sphingomonas piscis]
MRKLAFIAAALGLAATPAAAKPPKLLVVISIDQLSGDLFDEYRPHFTGGLARLAGGTAFRNAYQSHATTQTCPGHATLLTGGRPARTGIIANNWYNFAAPRADKQVYCAEDETAPGTTSDKYKVSPVHLKMPVLGELMKRRWPLSRSVAVAGKDRSAVMMGGHTPDQRWYWADGSFVTDLPVGPPPRSVALANSAAKQAIATARAPLQPPPLCAAKAQPLVIPTVKYRIGDGRFDRAAGDEDAFHDSPEFDAATLALAASLVQELGLGKGRATDLLAVSLSATDYVGHKFGPGGQEMCLQLLSVDRDLGGFFGMLDRAGIDYAVALSADHGGQDAPERLRLNGVAATRISNALSKAAVGHTIARQLGLPKSPLKTYGGAIYVDGSLPAETRQKIVAAALPRYRADRQVAAAFTKAELIATSMPTGSPVNWTLIQRARASFDPARSGDITVLLKPNINPVHEPDDSVATHGSPYDYDRRVPLLFWRKGMKPVLRNDAVETVDLMPTLAGLIRLPLTPGSVDGKCLKTVPGVRCPSR